MLFKDIFYLELLQPLSSADRNHMCNFGRRHHEELFCEIILNLDQWFRRKRRLKVFLIWSSGSPFVQWSATICAILVMGLMKNNSWKLFWILGQWFMRRFRLKDFLSGALAALMFGGVEPSMQFWKKVSWETFMWSYMKFGQVVQEEMSFKERFTGGLTDRGWTKNDHNSSPWAFGSGELKSGDLSWFDGWTIWWRCQNCVYCVKAIYMSIVGYGDQIVCFNVDIHQIKFNPYKPSVLLWDKANSANPDQSP